VTRHVVLVGDDKSLATTIRTLLDPDDRLDQVGGLEGWHRLPRHELDVVVVDLPGAVRLQAVEEVRSTFGGCVILLEPADDPMTVPSEYGCLVIQRPDLGALWNLTASGARLSTASSEVAEAEASLPGLGVGSTDWRGILLETISAQRPVLADPSQAAQPLATAPRRRYDHNLLQLTAVEVAMQLRADVVVLLLDNGAGLMEVSGAVGLPPAERRLSVEYSHPVMHELFWSTLSVIEDTSRISSTLNGIPGSQAQTLLLAMLVHDHSWIGVLIAGRNGSQAGDPTEVFTDTDIRTFIAAAARATPSVHTVIQLRRLERGLKAGKSGRPAAPRPATDAEASATASAAHASMATTGPSSTLPIQAAPSAPSTQDAPAQAAQSAGLVDMRSGMTGRAAAMLLAYLVALAAVDLVASSPRISVPVAVTSHGLLAVFLCVVLRIVAGQAIAVLLPPLIAISVVRLVTLGALPGDVSPLTRLVVVGVPSLVAVAMAARQRSPEWRLLRPHTGGWPGQLLVGLVGIPSALAVWKIAPPAVEVRGGASTMVAAILLVIFAALPEELLYRGLLVPAAAGVVGHWGVAFAAATYALAFVPGGSITTVLLAFLLGIVLGWCRWRTGSVVGVIGAHSLLNVIVYLVLPTSG